MTDSFVFIEKKYIEIKDPRIIICLRKSDILCTHFIWSIHYEFQSALHTVADTADVIAALQ